MIRRLAPRPDRPASRDRRRGAVIVEMALVAPLLILLGLGTVEFGYRWRTVSAATEASSAGARVAVTYWEDPQADYEIIAAVRASLVADDLLDSVERVVVFRAITTASPPVGCTGGTTPLASLCTAYGPDVVADATPADVGPDGCIEGALVRNWCPTVRRELDFAFDAWGGDLTYIGVLVVLRPGTVTGWFAADGVVQRQTLMRGMG